MRRSFGCERGQAALEFLLTLPMFFLMIFIAIDLGLVTFEYVTVANAAREAARFGAVNCGVGKCFETDIQARARQRAGGLIQSATIQVGWRDRTSAPVPAGNTNHDRGDSVIVRINHTYNFRFLPFAFPIFSCADMRLEQLDLSGGPYTDDTNCP